MHLRSWKSRLLSAVLSGSSYAWCEEKTCQTICTNLRWWGVSVTSSQSGAATLITHVRLHSDPETPRSSKTQLNIAEFMAVNSGLLSKCAVFTFALIVRTDYGELLVMLVSVVVSALRQRNKQLLTSTVTPKPAPLPVPSAIEEFSE